VYYMVVNKKLEVTRRKSALEGTQAGKTRHTCGIWDSYHTSNSRTMLAILKHSHTLPHCSNPRTRVIDPPQPACSASDSPGRCCTSALSPHGLRISCSHPSTRLLSLPPNQATGLQSPTDTTLFSHHHNHVCPSPHRHQRVSRACLELAARSPPSVEED